jgi:hypothetical protein
LSPRYASEFAPFHGGRNRAPAHPDKRKQIHDHNHGGDGEHPAFREGGPGGYDQYRSQDRMSKSYRVLDDPGIDDPMNAQSDA